MLIFFNTLLFCVYHIYFCISCSVVLFVWCNFCQISGSMSLCLFFLLCSIWILFPDFLLIVKHYLGRALRFVIFSLLLCQNLLQVSIVLNHDLIPIGAVFTLALNAFQGVLVGSLGFSCPNCCQKPSGSQPLAPTQLFVVMCSYLGFLGKVCHLILI